MQGHSQTFQNEGAARGAEGWAGGADRDSKCWLSIDLCTKCNFILGGKRGAEFLPEGAVAPLPPSGYATVWTGWFFQNFPRFESKVAANLRQFWKDWVILLKIWPKIGLTGIWMGHFFLKNWYLYGSTFKFCCGIYPYQNQTWVPPGQKIGNHYQIIRWQKCSWDQREEVFYMVNKNKPTSSLPFSM